MEAKIREYIRTWESRCYVNGLPDEAPAEINDRVPSYRRICIAILKNDVTLKSLGYTPPESETYGILKRIELGIPEPKKYNAMSELLVSEMKKFKQAAARVKSNNLIPILEYFKIEPGSITKNSLHSFVTMAISYKGKPFLIEQRILLNFVDRANTHINVAFKDCIVTLSGQDIPSVKSPTVPLDDFPAASDPDSEPVKINTAPLLTAARFIDEMETPERENIFIGNGFVRSCNGFIGYAEPYESTLNTFMDKQTCRAMEGHEEIMYADNQKYHFFSTDTLNYGFIKSQYKYLDLSAFFKLPDVVKFTVDKERWVLFNDMASSNAVSRVALTGMSIVDGSMALVMQDVSYNIDQTDTIPIDGGYECSFTYDPVMLNRLLKSVDGDPITVYIDKGRMYLTSSKWVALIMQLNINNNI